jgi:hypothetical protein
MPRSSHGIPDVSDATPAWPAYRARTGSECPTVRTADGRCGIHSILAGRHSVLDATPHGRACAFMLNADARRQIGQRI